jgi:hypothetical protein
MWCLLIVKRWNRQFGISHMTRTTRIGLSISQVSVPLVIRRKRRGGL